MDRIAPTAFQASLSLIEDYEQAATPPLAASLSSRFLSIQRSDDTSINAELIAVSLDNRLIHFERSETSGSGWNQTEFRMDGAPDRPIEQLVGFHQSQLGYVLAFYPTDSEGEFEAFGMQRGEDTNWRHMPFSPELQNAFGRVRQVDVFELSDGKQVISAISTNFAPPAMVLSILDPETQSWSIAFQQDMASSEASFALLPGWDGDELTVASFVGSTATFRGGSISDGRFVWGTRPPVEADFGLSISAKQLFAVKQGRLDQGFFVLSQSGNLLRVDGVETGQPSLNQLSGGDLQPKSVSSISVGVNAQGRVMLFAIDANDSRLWLLREDAGDSSPDTVGFEPWVALGNQVSAVAGPNRMAGDAEVFIYDLSANVRHLSQEPTQGCWFQETLKGPTQTQTSPEPISSYALHVGTIADGELPVPGQLVEIDVDRVCRLTVNGLSHPVIPEAPLRVLTDSSGRLSISSAANSLSSPTLTLKAMAATGPLFATTLRADDHARRRLAGDDPRFPVTGAVLKEKGFLPTSVDIADADRAADTIRNVAAAPFNFLKPPRKEAPKASLDPYYARFSFAKSGTFSSQTITAKQWQDALGTQSTGNPEFSLSDVFGDIANFLKNALHWLEDVVVKIEGKIVEVALTIGSAVKHFVLDSIDKVAGFIEVFFAKLGEAISAVGETIRKVIDWLREIFAWDDILLTKDVLKVLCGKTFGFVRGNLDERLPAFLLEKFSGWKEKVEKAFDDFERSIGPDLNFNGLVPTSNQPVTAGGSPLLALAGKSAMKENMVRCDYVRGHVLNASAQGTALLRASIRSSPESESLFAELIAAFETAFPTEELERSAARIRGLAEQIKDPATFIEVSLAVILEAIKDLILLVLGAIEALILAFCNLAASAFKLLEETVEGVIDIPILSGLYFKLTGSELTLLDLVALLIATPTTILYKLLNGGQEHLPPFTKQDLELFEKSVLPWPELFGVPQKSPAGMASSMSFPPGAAAGLGVANIFASMGYFAFDFGLDIQAAFENSGKPPGTSRVPSILSVVSSITVQMLGAPWSLWTTKPQPEWNEADKWLTANWTLLFLPVLSDSFFIIFSETGRVQRFSKLGGPWISMVEGGIVLATGIGAAVEMADPNSGYKPANQAAVLLPAFPYIAQPLVLLGLEPDPKGFAVAAALLVIDAVGDIGSAVASASA